MSVIAVYLLFTDCSVIPDDLAGELAADFVGHPEIGFSFATSRSIIASFVPNVETPFLVHADRTSMSVMYLNVAWTSSFVFDSSCNHKQSLSKDSAIIYCSRHPDPLSAKLWKPQATACELTALTREPLLPGEV